MLHSGNALFDQILIPFILWLFAATGAIGVFLGLSLLVSGPQILRSLAGMNRWISTREQLKPLETPRNVEGFFYGRRMLFGSVFVVGGIFIVYALFVEIDPVAVVAALTAGARGVASEMLIRTLRWLLVIGGVVAILVGALLILSPGALRTIGSRLNRWYSPRQFGRDADNMNMTLDRWVEENPRVAGLMLTIGSATVIIGAMTAWLRS